MDRPPEDQSLPELVIGLATTIPNLLRDELDLLKRELALALARLQSASALLVVATALAIAAVILLVAAAVSGLTILLLAWGLAPATAVSLASLAIALLGAVVCAVLVVAARNEIAHARTAIERGLGALHRPANSPEEPSL